MSRYNIFLHFKARPRLVAGIVSGVVLWAALPEREAPINAIIGFDGGVVLFLVLTWWMIRRATPSHMRQQARREDVGQVTVLALTVVGALVSMAAIAELLHGVKDMPESRQVVHVALGATSVVCSWVLTHTLFALHYAHVFYGDTDGDWGTPDRNEGLLFPNREHPDYWDFLYFSMTLGMTAQTSDVNVTSPTMRRVALGHSVLSFFFNTVILALSVNIAAGLL